MRQIFISLTTIITSLSSLSSNLFADTQTEYPKLYKSLWPDYCYEHLLKGCEAYSDLEYDNPDAYSWYPMLNKKEASTGTPASSITNIYIYEGSTKEYFSFAAPFFPYPFSITIDHLIECENDVLYLPHQNTHCPYAFCNVCKKPVQKSLGYFSTQPNTKQFKIHSTCDCTKNPFSYIGQAIHEDCWTVCENHTIPSPYFNQYTSKYYPLLRHHFQYSKENPSCTCYWPYVSNLACTISNLVYDSMDCLFQNSCLWRLKSRDFYWYIEDTFSSELIPEIEKERLIRAIQNYFIFAFFYSNYHTAVTDLCKYVDVNGTSKDLDKLYSILTTIRPLFLNLYSNCIDKHPHPKIYYERGMVHFHNGDIYPSLCDMKNFINSADTEELETLVTSNFYLQEGSSYAELGQYDEAIEALTKSIAKDPTNKEAYFERASAYFETGDFDLAIADYLESGMKPTLLDPNDLISIEFSKYLMSGILKGTGEAAIDFVPSILSSINGLSHALWAFGCDPLNCSKEMVSTCNEMIELLSQKSSLELLEAFIPEIRDFNNSTSNEEKARLLGYMIGKYGTELFAPIGIMKTYKKFKTANKLLTLEHLAQESKQATVIKEAAGNWKQAHVESIEKFRSSEKFLKTYKSQSLHENQVRKILHQAGFATFPRPKGIPENFKVTFSDRGCGMKYINPNNNGTYVRVMPGKPHSMLPHQQKPYVIQLKDGKTLDKFGNIIPEKSIEAHIPLDEFIYHHD